MTSFGKFWRLNFEGMGCGKPNTKNCTSWPVNFCFKSSKKPPGNDHLASRSRWRMPSSELKNGYRFKYFNDFQEHTPTSPSLQPIRISNSADIFYINPPTKQKKSKAPKNCQLLQLFVSFGTPFFSGTSPVFLRKKQSPTCRPKAQPSLGSRGYLVGGCNCLWKICRSQIASFPPVMVKINFFELPPPRYSQIEDDLMMFRSFFWIIFVFRCQFGNLPTVSPPSWPNRIANNKLPSSSSGNFGYPCRSGGKKHPPAVNYPRFWSLLKWISAKTWRPTPMHGNPSSNLRTLW